MEYEDQVQDFFSAKAKKHLNHKGKLRAEHVTAVLETIDGAMWTGPVYMGRFSPMDVVFDTGSDWLVIEDDKCTTCEGNTYNAESSGVATGTGISERSYGSAYLTGTEFKDVVCLLLSSCVTNFEYFAIYTQTGIREPIDGILGMARGGNYFYLGDLTRQSGPLYIDAMIQDRLIKTRVFSFYLALNA